MQLPHATMPTCSSLMQAVHSIHIRFPSSGLISLQTLLGYFPASSHAALTTLPNQFSRTLALGADIAGISSHARLPCSVAGG